MVCGMCSEGGINKVLSGKAYNNCWRVHEILGEAIHRLFHKAYVKLHASLDKSLKASVKEMLDFETVQTSEDITKPILKWGLND